MGLADLAATAAAAAALSAALCAAASAYARRRGLLDLPGRRRSHAVPTPRGGGIGIVGAVLAIALGPRAIAGDALAATLGAALLAVAAIGWWDDHRPLSARLRLVVHLGAALAVALGVLGAPHDLPAAAALVLVALAIAWSVNLHNFIDGINGLLGLQALAIASVLGASAALAGEDVLARWCVVVAAACAGFLPFNLPRARIFLGDVGSGALGLLLGALALLAWRRGVLDGGALLMLLSACAVDATATLVSRMARGRRWWRPHREHLYQWLVRSGASHDRVALLYLAWTAAVVPLLLAARAALARTEWALTHASAAESLYFTGWPAATLLSALGLWWAGKRACLRRARARNP
jgi:UDP-N-acetylmuramyl pentapeptide phosphotransferase/UDP-N-acetylglucosamine-1-phosphate transferase